MLRHLKVITDYLKQPQNLWRNVRWRVGMSRSNEPMIFVVGAPRSGTTLLQKIVSLHPAVGGFDGETGMFSARNIFVREYFGFDEETNKALLNQSSDLIDFVENCAKTIRERDGVDYVVEKTPQHAFHSETILRHFNEAIIIHIIRDGRDCYLSALNHPNVPQSSSATRFAIYWRKAVRSYLAVKDHPRVMQIRYEDFVTSPETTLAAVMEKIGLEAVDEQLQTERIATDARSSREQFARLAKPIDGSSCGRWKTEISKADLERFLAVAGEELRMFGYETTK